MIPGRAALRKYTASRFDWTDPDNVVPATQEVDGQETDRVNEPEPTQMQVFEEPVFTAKEQKAKQARHEEWQKRIGQGLFLPRRNSLPLDEHGVPPETAEMDPEDIDQLEQEEEIAAKSKTKLAKNKSTLGKKKEALGPSGLTYTPLEKQFMEIKAANPDVLLLTEVGYKFKFHGDDAKVASKELGIACFPLRNFYSASIPVHRLHIHVKKLIARGHKVGVVRQTETAALKAAGENRNKPFERKMTHLYTAATYVDDSSLQEQDDEMAGLDDPATGTNAFVCINEQLGGGNGSDDKVKISMIGVYCGTGEVMYDEFSDSHLRNELEVGVRCPLQSKISFTDPTTCENRLD